MKTIRFFAFHLIFLFSFSANAQSILKNGIWRATILVDNGQKELPFSLEISEKEKGKQSIYILNGKERLLLQDLKQKNDSIFVKMHIFDGAILAKIEGNKMHGIYRKYDAKDPQYFLPFQAEAGVNYRFKPLTNNKPTTNISGRWAVTFRGETADDTTQSVGIFEQKSDGHLTGTFLTTTGDYRFLEGYVENNTLKMSAFDGSHAFLFAADINGNKITNGHFWAGTTGHETWTATANPNAALPDAESLTFLKKGYERLDFSFPNLEGKKISLSDKQFKDKVVIVQMLGSWCPNCMDETAFLSDWYAKQDTNKVAIIGLGFERKKEFSYAKQRLEIMKKRFNIRYPLLVAGIANKDSAAAVLPALQQVLAFPTTIIIDKKGKVRYIHTGFSGQGTGQEYEKFVADFRKKIAALSNEK